MLQYMHAIIKATDTNQSQRQELCEDCNHVLTAEVLVYYKILFHYFRLCMPKKSLKFLIKFKFINAQQS